MALLARMHELVGQGCQFVVAMHSPVLLALPGAGIVHLEDTGPRPVGYDEAMPVELTRAFLADPGRSLRHLLGDPSDLSRL